MVDDYYRVSDGAREGISAARLRRQYAPLWGVRASTPSEDLPAIAAAFATRMPDSAFYYGVTAAELHGLPLPAERRTRQLHVGVPAGIRRVEARGVTPHHVRISGIDIRFARGHLLTSVARTWCDLAAVGLTVPQLVAAGDRALWVRDPLTDREAIWDAIGRYDGRRGARRMRDAFELLDGRADSPPESELRALIVLAGLPRPEVNAPITVAGHTIHPDMCWPRHRVLLEYEGDHHRTDRQQWRGDIRRYSAARRESWAVLQATGDDYRAPSRLLTTLRRSLP